MKFRNIIVAVAVGLIAILGAIAPAHAGELAGILPTINTLGAFINPEGASLAMLALAMGNVDLVEVKALAEKQAKAWEDFKVANDARLKEIEAKGHDSAAAKEAVAKINTDLTEIAKQIKSLFDTSDSLEKRLNRPGAGGEGKADTPEMVEYKKAVSQYLREGKNLEAARELGRKAMSGQSDPDGGLLTHPDLDTEIDRVASVVTNFRSLASVRTIGGTGYKKLVKTRGVSGGWVGESEASAETNSPQFSEIDIPAHRMYAEPWVFNDLLEDADYDLEMDLAEEVGITFRELEGNAFLNGTGVKQAKGFLSETPVANASYAWGRIGYIATGNSGAFDGSNPADDVVTLMHALRQTYRPGASFLMADSTLAIMRQFKDGSGSYYLWNPDPTSGPSGRFLGAPVVVDDYMPVIAPNSYSVAYGDFRRGYQIVDRRGIALIRDQVTAKGTTKFHFSKRVGGGVKHFEAIKLLKFGTS
jgi:HK97 family phage major capsid protein